MIDCFTILKCITNEPKESDAFSSKLVINREPQRSNMSYLRDDKGGLKPLNSAVCTRNLERIRFEGSCKAKRVAQSV